jgi:probable rRNA maturation factor
MATVQFFYNEVSFPFSNRQGLKKFIVGLFKKEGKRLQALQYVFCTDAYLLQVNRDFLQHDDYTDIITFDLSDSPSAISGEIYISIDRVRDNARQLGNTFKEELHRVIFHGALHLCGYRDKKPAEIKAMRAGEERYLEGWLGS